MTSTKYSIVVAMYNVEKYIDAFLDSLKMQSYPLNKLDVIIVDDGSIDNSVQRVETWNRRNRAGIKLYKKQNGGPGSARNVGLDYARGTWITFADPDDVLHPDYFLEIEKFLKTDGQHLAEMLTTRLVQHEDGTIKVNRNHPLDWKFRHGNRLVDMNEKPNHVHLSGATVLLKRAVIERNRLRFDERIRPKFEDANFVGKYLASVEDPIVGVIAKAQYYYRKRSDGSSLVQGAWLDPRVYDEVPNLGYLGLLEFVRDRLGILPAWAQYMVLYDVVWMYLADRSMHSGIGGITVDQQESTLTALDKIFSTMDRESIVNFSAVGTGWTFHNMLTHHYKTPMEATPVVVDWGANVTTGTRKFSYFFSGSLPAETFIGGEKEISPLSEKVIDHAFLGRVLVRERVFIVPDLQFKLLLDGKRARTTSKPILANRSNAVLSNQGRLKLSVLSKEDILQFHQLSDSNRSAIPLPGRIANHQRRIDKGIAKVKLQAQLTGLHPTAAAIAAANRVVSRKLELSSLSTTNKQLVADTKILKSATSPHSKELYAKSWVLLDRKDRADDNAEHLYRYLAGNTNENIWFLLERNSPDWIRLARDGFKLMEYGSPESVSLVLNAEFVISSHADRDIQYPIDTKRFGKPAAKVVFLQHGVTKDDLSRWINGKSLSLMITASHEEHQSIVGNNNSYKWGQSTVKLTGFPRHDRLIELSAKNPMNKRKLLLIAPTWRQYVTDVIKSHTTVQAKVQHFIETDFGKNWIRVLSDPRLAEFTKRTGVNVAFLGHPNLAEIVNYLPIPSNVKVLNYEELSVQETLVDSCIVISDYSSLAFEAAIAGCNVVHFQFDGNEIFKGGHVYRKGYFDYKLHGFGQVMDSPIAVVDEVLRISGNGFIRDEQFAIRTSNSFPNLDGHASARVTEAIRNLNRRWDEVASTQLFDAGRNSMQ